MSVRLVYTTDVLIIGAGLAAERSAITAAEKGLECIILSLVPPRRSHSTAAQGGMQASLGNVAMGYGDNPQIHFEDTVKGSDWGCDQEVARIFAETVPSAVRQTSYWGTPWSRVIAGQKTLPDGTVIEERKEKEGLIAARNFGGTAKWRTNFCADGTGHSIQYAIDAVVCQHGIPVHDRMEAISLIHDGVTCYGAVARCLRTGELVAYVAKSTVIGAGGYGRLYEASTTAVICEGTGGAIALDTGIVPLGNMEAVQFHPTGIVPVWILVTEGARGDGGYLLDKNLYRFMPDYEPNKKELASRDVVARHMTRRIREGYGAKSHGIEHVWLDIRHLGAEHINVNLREIATICKNFAGIDPVHELIPVKPTQHYCMGGVRTNARGAAYGLKGLYAVGEAACWDLHGFNRLGGNSLAETVVAGMVCGEEIAKDTLGASLNYNSKVVEDAVKRQEERIRRLIRGRDGKEDSYKLKLEMQQTLQSLVGIFRTGSDLQKAVNKLQEIQERTKRIGLKSDGKYANPELANALRVPGMVKMAMCIATGALARTESRGSHFREDYPRRDDKNWLKRTLAYWKPGDNMPTLKYEDVKCDQLPPGDRGYGEGSANSTVKAG